MTNYIIKFSKKRPVKTNFVFSKFKTNKLNKLKICIFLSNYLFFNLLSLFVCLSTRDECDRDRRLILIFFLSLEDFIIASMIFKLTAIP